MSEQTTIKSGHRWLILSFAFPCLIVGLTAVGILVWDMWGSSEPLDIAVGALQSFFWFGIPSGLVGIPVGYVINQIRSRGLFG
jgi:hypothetical protein